MASRRGFAVRAVIKEQMSEINELQSENENLKRLLEEKTNLAKEVKPPACPPAPPGGGGASSHPLDVARR